MDKFQICQGKGFKLTIDGITLSVQFGMGNYCEKRDYAIGRGKEKEKETDCWESTNAEIAVWDESNVWITKRVVKDVLKETLGDEVMGWVTPYQVGKIIAWMTKRAKRNQTKKEKGD